MTISAEGYADPAPLIMEACERANRAQDIAVALEQELGIYAGVVWREAGQTCACGHGEAAHGRDKPSDPACSAWLCKCTSFDPVEVTWQGRITLPVGQTPGGVL